MRRFFIMAALALAGCDGATDDAGDGPENVAFVSYDGADYATEAEKIAHGRRVAAIMGCTGCHGRDYEGGEFTDSQYAPNLSLLLPRIDDATLVRAIRKGIGHDGRNLFMMPSGMFATLSERDFAAIIADLRSRPERGRQQPPYAPSPEMKAIWDEVGYTGAPQEVAEFAEAGGPIDLGQRFQRGRYLAQTACTECHAANLQGYEGETPDLNIAGAYDEKELAHLLDTGIGLAREDLGLMSVVAKYRFANFTPAEQADLIAYLHERARRAPAE